MLDIHKKIIEEVVYYKSKDPKVIAILLFGSVARGTATNESDIDIEIIYEDGEYKDYSETINGIKVDYEIWPKNKLLHRVKNYPFLSYPYIEEKILYDPQGFAKSFVGTLEEYFQNNPDALKEWQKWTKEYLDFKQKGIKRSDDEIIKSCTNFYDKIEIKFSKEHKITRDF